MVRLITSLANFLKIPSGILCQRHSLQQGNKTSHIKTFRLVISVNHILSNFSRIITATILNEKVIYTNRR